ncbi:MAG: alginate export family protein [Thiovulaceae bacterium]|nr:alginate export family protein [Sulfurimonadaceae bacterium]
MKKMLLSMAAVPCLLISIHVNASADDGINILSNVKFSGEIRPRYEYVDAQNSGKEIANAFTARTTLGVGADLFQIDGLSAFLEGSAVSNFGDRNYNGTIDGNTKYDIVADPQQARITQAYIDYKINKTLVRAGRQDVNLDNQRFIGTVDWRQMKQTFDAVALVDNSIENLSLLGAYVYGVNGVKNQSFLSTAATGLSTNEAYDTSSVLLHATYKINDMLHVTAYDYMLASISDTYGAALTGNIDAGTLKLDYRAEYAKQADPSLERRSQSGASAKVGISGKPEADARYYNLDLGANVNSFLAGVNYESLGKAEGSSVIGFWTPLATLHAFNGWADVFLGSTNNAGLNDANVRLGYAEKTFGKVLAVYHKFDAQKNIGTSKDLGSEFDVSYGNKIPKINNLTALIKGAFYKGGNATGFTNDKTVAWLMLDYKFATK